MKEHHPYLTKQRGKVMSDIKLVAGSPVVLSDSYGWVSKVEADNNSFSVVLEDGTLITDVPVDELKFNHLGSPLQKDDINMDSTVEVTFTTWLFTKDGIEEQFIPIDEQTHHTDEGSQTVNDWLTGIKDNSEENLEAHNDINDLARTLPLAHEFEKSNNELLERESNALNNHPTEHTSYSSQPSFSLGLPQLFGTGQALAETLRDSMRGVIDLAHHSIDSTHNYFSNKNLTKLEQIRYLSMDKLLDKVEENLDSANNSLTTLLTDETISSALDKMHTGTHLNSNQLKDNVENQKTIQNALISQYSGEWENWLDEFSNATDKLREVDQMTPLVADEVMKKRAIELGDLMEEQSDKMLPIIADDLPKIERLNDVKSFLSKIIDSIKDNLNQLLSGYAQTQQSQHGLSPELRPQ